MPTRFPLCFSELRGGGDPINLTFPFFPLLFLSRLSLASGIHTFHYIHSSAETSQTFSEASVCLCVTEGFDIVRQRSLCARVRACVLVCVLQRSSKLHCDGSRVFDLD